jgi:hypothetical protein
MKHRCVRFAAPLLPLILTPTMIAQFQMPSLGGIGQTPGQKTGLGSALGAGLDSTQIASGLKQALSLSTEKAVKEVSRPGGYAKNPAIAIPLPGDLRTVAKIARDTGQGAKVDSLIASMNRAAESAAPAAAPIFASAVRNMSIGDARKVLNGGSTSITDYFKAKTSDQLAAAFRPHVVAAMKTNGVEQQFESLMARAPQVSSLLGGLGGLGGGSGSKFDLNSYVVKQALNGLFTTMGQQEQQIRTNPAARSTSLLQKLFEH